MTWTHLDYFIRSQNRRKFVLFALCAILAASFIIISSEVREADAGQVEAIGRIDAFASEFFAGLRTPLLSEITINLTALGSTTVLTIVVFLTALFAIFLKMYFVAISIVTAGLGAGIWTTVLKSYFERSRPPIEFRLVDVAGYSYPSGHSLSASAVYFTLAIVCSAMLSNSVQRVILGGLFLGLVLIVGLSRIYLGVHYFSDVLAGILLGIGWAVFLCTSIAVFTDRRK